MLKHGGGIRQAALTFKSFKGEWLDLSTGINPLGWKVPAIPASAWLRLPEDDDGLEKAAEEYYKSKLFLPVAGSQAVIQALPQLKENFRVAILSPTYSEHAHAWIENISYRHKNNHYKALAHNVDQLDMQELDAQIELYDVVVVVNPNNPTGTIIKKKKMLEWWQRLQIANTSIGQTKWLIIDEAFMDCTPENSLISEIGEPGLIILRSLGKFFGLAGARIGFVFAWPELLESIRELLGPWTTTTPSRFVASKALLDKEWQNDTISSLEIQQKRLTKLLSDNGLKPESVHQLFQWVTLTNSEDLYAHLARQGILIRHLDQYCGVRFGLPGVEPEWERLAVALKTWQLIC